MTEPAFPKPFYVYFNDGLERELWWGKSKAQVRRDVTETDHRVIYAIHPAPGIE